MRKLEGTALKKTMAEMKKAKSTDLKAKNKVSPLRKSGMLKKNRKMSPAILKSTVACMGDNVMVNGKEEGNGLAADAPVKEETVNGGAKLLEDESDPYCPDFDETPTLLPLIGRKRNLKHLQNNFLVQDSLLNMDQVSTELNGDVKENIIGALNTQAASSSIPKVEPSSNGLTGPEINSVPKKVRKKKMKTEPASEENVEHEQNGVSPKSSPKRKGSLENSADTSAGDSMCSPPKKKKKGKIEIPCEKCSKVFHSQLLHDRHMKICQLDEEELDKLQPHKCTVCDYRSSKKAMVTRHLESHGIFKCVKCTFVTDTKETFREHNLAEHADRIDMKLCKVCSRYVKCVTVTLDEHMKTCPGKMPLICPECKKEFKYESSLNVHLNSHYPDRPKRFTCELCDYKSNYKANLQKHITCMHGSRDRTFPCEICKKLFYTEESLKRHTKVHADKYICPVCGQECKSSSALKSHKALHNPKIACTFSGCTEVFRNVIQQNKHEENCHQVSPKRFQCRSKGCNLSFLKRSHLRRHEITHTGERKYRCEWEGCGKAFRHADNLKVHIRQHTNENPVKCELCDFTCKQKSSLRWHMGKQHAPKPVKTEVKDESLVDPQEDAAFWEAVMAVIGPDGTGLEGETIDPSSLPIADVKNNKKKSGTSKKKKLSLNSEIKKKKVSKGKSDKIAKSKKKKKKSVSTDIKVEVMSENPDGEGKTAATSGETIPKKKKKTPKTQTLKSGKKSKSKKNKNKEEAVNVLPEAELPVKEETLSNSNQCEQDVCESESVEVSVPLETKSQKVTPKKIPKKGNKPPKGKRLSKSKAVKIAKGKGASKKSKKAPAKAAKKLPKKTPKSAKEVVEAVTCEDLGENKPEETISKKKRKRGKPAEDKEVEAPKPKRTRKTPAKKEPKPSKAKKASPKTVAKKKVAKATQKKSPNKRKPKASPKKSAKVKEESQEAEEPAAEEVQPQEINDKPAEPDIKEEELKEPDEPCDELDSDSDLWGNNDNTNEEPDRNCDADDERDLDNEDDMDKASESGFLGDFDKAFGATDQKPSQDEDARSTVSDTNNSVSDVASLDDAIPDTPPRAPMRLDDNQEEVDENDYYEPPPSPPPGPVSSVDQTSVERQDSEQTVLDNSLPHSNNTCTPQDVLTEDGAVQDGITLDQDTTPPTYVRTPQSQQPEVLPGPTDKDYFGQYLHDLPAVDSQSAAASANQDTSPSQVPEDLSNIQIPSGDVVKDEEIKALDLRPEPVSTITHTRLQRETVTGLPNANIERETVSTITHTSRTVQPIVTQPVALPMPGMQTDVMSYQRMELLACGRPDNFIQQKESSLQRLTSITYQNFGSLDSVNPTCRDMNYLRSAENMFPRSCAGGSFMRVTDGDSTLGRAGMNSLLRQPDTTFARPDTSLTRAANPSLLRPGTEDLFARDAMGRPVSRSPFHGAWTGQEIRPAHWNQSPYLQRPVDRAANTATPALLGSDRDFAFDPSRSLTDQNMFSNLTSQQHDLPRDTPFQLDRFDISSYFSHPYSTPPALEYGHTTCGANQKALEERLRQPSAVPDLRALPQPPSTDMLNQFCGINVNPSFNLDKYMYARDPVYRPQHVTGTSDSAFLSHAAPSQPTYFGRDYASRTLYPQSNPYALMDERQYSSAAKLTHPAGVQQERDIMGRRTTANDNQIQDPYRRSVIYNVMNRFYE